MQFPFVTLMSSYFPQFSTNMANRNQFSKQNKNNQLSIQQSLQLEVVTVFT